MLRSIAATMGLLAVLWTPIAQSAPCGGFTDVDDTDPVTAPFCASIEWIKNRGITLGCASPPNPPNSYCPNENVSRLQMAAFMYRLGFQNAFLQGGNAFGAPATLGTNDDQPMEIRVNGANVMRYESTSLGPNVIGGHAGNTVSALFAQTIAGGGMPGNTCADPPNGSTRSCSNYTFGGAGTIGGGVSNRANVEGTVGGGVSNSALGESSTVGGGQFNSALSHNTTVAGGQNNTAADQYASVGGGIGNLADEIYATVGGGRTNLATASATTIAGGEFNTASNTLATVAGGLLNIASGGASAVPGGERNAAAGDYSFAAGRNAKANSTGCFAWGDSHAFDVNCNTANAFMARATGGVTFVTGIDVVGTPVAGVQVGAGGNAWMPLSDRNAKRNIEPVDVAETLRRVVDLPIARWGYLSEPSALRHIGPMAQDFHAAFGLGSSDRHIVTIDADGVALAAIQGLNAKLEATVAEQAKENARLRAELADLRSLKEEVASIRAAQSSR